MYSHRLRRLRTPLICAPNTSVAVSSHWPHASAQSLPRHQFKRQPEWCNSGWRLSTLVCWVMGPIGHANSLSILGGQTLVHTTQFAVDDEVKIRLVEAAMGISLPELAWRRSQRYH